MSGLIRCAVYTRKSTEEGLDQSFNSLDAQREACEAYIKSQAAEGWRAIPTTYDDGGFSGGNLDRPAMHRLLSDVDASKVDVIVVYKVDRLTRSLLDFAKIVERLDARSVSFVSVTQAFNTTTSMGRLTLNVLLSFAQFEREVTSERIRDKIAASKAKGMWMGGNVPLGYDLGDRRLIVNAAEAATVRLIFSRYLELGSGVALARELCQKGIFSKRWLSRNGRERGGAPFSCGALYYLLQNRLYLGVIVHRDAVHSGEQEAIVTKELFDSVQHALAQRRSARRRAPARATHFHLAGLVLDAKGAAMTTSFSYGRGGRQYRYYVSGSLDPLDTACRPPRRVPAAPLERLILDTMVRLIRRDVTFPEIVSSIRAVELLERSIQLTLNADGLLEPHEPLTQAVARLQPLVAPVRVVVAGSELRLIIDRQPVFRGGKVGQPTRSGSTLDVGTAAALLRNAHQLLQAHSMSPFDLQSHSRAAAPAWQRQRRTMALALVAPAVQKAILQGRFSGSLEKLTTDLPLLWADQLALISVDRGMKARL